MHSYACVWTGAIMQLLVNINELGHWYKIPVRPISCLSHQPQKITWDVKKENTL